MGPGLSLMASGRGALLGFCRVHPVCDLCPYGDLISRDVEHVAVFNGGHLN